MAGFQHTHDTRPAQPQRTRVPEPARPAPAPFQLDTASVIDLQRVIGNQAVQRLMADAGIQAKMTVGAADDAYEREADAVANQVISASAQAPVQRAALGEEEEEPLQMMRIQRAGPEEEELQMSRDSIQRAGGDLSGSFDVESGIEQQIQKSQGSGQALPDTATSQFAQTMGHDFSGVNIHTDSSADTLNRSLGARAFTTGSDIYFRSGEYNPGSSDGQRLLAHELTHVVQQTGGSPVQTRRKKDDDCADCG
jgi:hypothetical protein